MRWLNNPPPNPELRHAQALSFHHDRVFRRSISIHGSLANATPLPQQPPSVTDTAGAAQDKSLVWNTENRISRLPLRIGDNNDTEPPSGILRSLDEGNQQFNSKSNSTMPSSTLNFHPRVLSTNHTWAVGQAD